MSTPSVISDELEFGGPARRRGPHERVSALVSVVENFPENSCAAGPGDTTFGMVGRSIAMRRVFERIALVAATDATVLVLGETGTGKELIARAIHASSARANRPFVTVNCGVLSEALVASELFGHERGSFTGAMERRKGRFEIANGGTIFLDEVGELSPALQVALLRVLQEGEFERVGGTETQITDVRIVAATNRDLDQAVREGRVRSDFLYRLNVLPIAVPPLRERKDDIPLIVEHYARHYARKFGKRNRDVGSGAMEALVAYSWPGNIRELQNVVERAVILAHGNVLGLPDFELPDATDHARNAQNRPAGLREQIEFALAASHGRVHGVGGAAETLGVAASTLESRIRRLGIDKCAFYRRCLTAADAGRQEAAR